MYGLALGVASSVIALSAARCVPFSSCNAGAFGGHHHEAYPVVAFHARPAHVDLLLECAKEAGCGLEHGSNGCIVLYAREIESLRRFAAEVIQRRSAFRKLRLRAPRANRNSCDETPADQLTLF
jgi:hypothetical protein